MTARAADALVVGGGPAGATAAIRLAREGHHVVVIERNPPTRPFGYGNLITPIAIGVLDRLGLTDRFRLHPIAGVRLSSGDRTLSVPWPGHPDQPGSAATVHRNEFDATLLHAAADAGATVLAGHSAIGPIVDRGFVRGARVVDPDGVASEVRADYTIVADGANSTFGRELGTSRQQNWPYALAQSVTIESPLHGATEIEMVLDLRDNAGTPITGFGWMFPGGNDTVNVGVLLVSTSPSFQVINPAHVLDRFVGEHRDRWLLAPRPRHHSATGRIPLGLSVGPSAGPTYLLVGDAAGAANPLSGSGVDTALETGLLAAEVLGEAIESASALVLQRYPQLLDERFGAYYQVGRLSDRLLGQPRIATQIGRLAARHRTAADVVIRIAANQLRPGRGGVAEHFYRALRALTVVAPSA